MNDQLSEAELETLLKKNPGNKLVERMVREIRCLRQEVASARQEVDSAKTKIRAMHWNR